MVSTQSQNTRDVDSILALGVVSPIFITLHNTATRDQDPMQATRYMVYSVYMYGNCKH